MVHQSNQASNLELEFNLQDPQYGSFDKVDQDGNGLEGVEFDLYEADANWKPTTNDPIATLKTDEDGSVNFVHEDDSIIVFDENKNYVLKEVETLPGYVTQGDIHLTYNDETATLKVDNQ